MASKFLQKAANKAGEYNLYVGDHPEYKDEQVVCGSGGYSDWGQPEGLSEDHQ
jgi:hypothetical protein